MNNIFNILIQVIKSIKPTKNIYNIQYKFVFYPNKKLYSYIIYPHYTLSNTIDNVVFVDIEQFNVVSIGIEQ